MPNNITNVGFGPDQSALMEIERRKALASALQNQSMQPIENQAAPGGWAVPINPLQGLNKIAQAGVGAYGQAKAQELAQALGQQQQERRSADMSLLSNALMGRQAQPGGLSEDASGNVTQMDPIAAQTPVQGIGQALPMMQDPQMQQMGMQALMGAQQRQDAQRFQADQAEQSRQARLQERLLALDAASQNATLAREERATRAKEAADLRRELQASQQSFVASQSQQKNTPKLPTPALKMQQELVDEIGLAENLSADLAALGGQLSSGELRVGPVRNMMNAARNNMGMSNAESQNFNTFKTTLERLRNDSLRLNKGVQTEGDAQRAWNELMGSINDPAVVSKRLQEIQGINQRAANMKRMQIDQIRSNFGLEAMEATAPQASPISSGADRRQSPRGGGTRVVSY